MEKMSHDATQTDFEKTCSQALKRFGQKKQMVATVEELAELQQVLCKKVNARNVADARIQEEIVDCYVMLEQMKKVFFKGDEFERVVKKKLRKVKSKLVRSEKVS